MTSVKIKLHKSSGDPASRNTLEIGHASRPREESQSQFSTLTHLSLHSILTNTCLSFDSLMKFTTLPCWHHINVLPSSSSYSNSISIAKSFTLKRSIGQSITYISIRSSPILLSFNLSHSTIAFILSCKPVSSFFSARALTSCATVLWNHRWCKCGDDLTTCWGCRTFQTASHIHLIHILGVWTPETVVDGDMAAHSYRYHHRGFPRFGKVCWNHRWLCVEMIPLRYRWGCRTLQTASHIHVIHILGVWTP